MTYAPANTETGFLPTSEVFPQDQSQLLIKLTETYINVAGATNIREIASYQDTLQVITGQQFSTPSNPTVTKFSFRKMFYFGAIAQGAVLSIAHGITGLVQFTHMYGTCITAVPDFRPIPCSVVDFVTGGIALFVDSTNIKIQNGTTSSNITSGLVVVEYLLN